MVAVVEENPLPIEVPETRYRLGVWVAMASILMLFTSLTSAYIVRAASSSDWRPIAMPPILVLSTIIILVSSGTLEAARRKRRLRSQRSYRVLLCFSVLLGLSFLTSQLVAWRQLEQQGIYLAGNPHSSFFYLLTATHGLHVIGGLLALSYLLVRTRRYWPRQRREAKDLAIIDAVALYWHFMDALWIYLFLLLFFWR